MGIKTLDDKIVFSPENISINFCPVAKDTGKETFILGTFNPGMARLKNGNILLMIRIAEALKGLPLGLRGALRDQTDKHNHIEYITKRKLGTLTEEDRIMQSIDVMAQMKTLADGIAAKRGGDVEGIDVCVEMMDKAKAENE